MDKYSLAAPVVCIPKIVIIPPGHSCITGEQPRPEPIYLS